MQNKKQCSLLNYLSIRDLDKFFPKKYRENSFFKHDLIPKNLKSYETFYQHYIHDRLFKTPKRIQIITKNNLNFIANSTEQIKVVDCSSNEEADQETLTKELGPIEDKVIHFDSLIGVSVALSKKQIHETFKKSLEKAFVKKGYMQF